MLNIRGLLCAAALLLLSFCKLVWQGNAHERITTRITFNKEIVRILARRCMGCHHAGRMAPMPLTTYTDARPWAKAIKEEVLERRMPAWRAVPGYGEFANDPRLSSRDLDLIVAWVDGGAPKGEDKDLPKLPDFSQVWPLGKPDLLLKPRRPFTVSAEAEDEYRCFVLSNPSTENRWISAVDLRPGDGSVVHHAFIWIDRSRNGEQQKARDEIPGCGCFGGPRIAPSGILGGWVPGQPARYTKGNAYLLPARARLVVQAHCRKNGNAGEDVSQVGLYFSKEPVEKRLRSMAVVNRKFEIPPGAAAFKVKAFVTLEKDAEAAAVLPHMHLLGKSMEITAVRPDGTREVLVWVRDYDFKGQTSYVFKRPVPLPRGTRVEVIAYYDNSEQNRRNPNKPPKAVRWGESTTDETCVAYLTYTLKE